VPLAVRGDGEVIVASPGHHLGDGFELTARIRADQRHRDLPIIIVTSRDSREDWQRSTQAGADAYIVKGRFDEDRLLDTVRRLI